MTAAASAGSRSSESRQAPEWTRNPPPAGTGQVTYGQQQACLDRFSRSVKPSVGLTAFPDLPKRPTFGSMDTGYLPDEFR